MYIDRLTKRYCAIEFRLNTNYRNSANQCTALDCSFSSPHIAFKLHMPPMLSNSCHPRVVKENMRYWCAAHGSRTWALERRPGSHLEIHISSVVLALISRYTSRFIDCTIDQPAKLPYHDFPRGEQTTPSPTRRWRSPPRPRRRSKDDAISHAEMALTSAPTTALKRATRRPCRASPTPLPPQEQTWELACLYLGCRRP